ncbi:hypothetical protein [Bhargavaea ginsengi]|uniref:hypothetical protein n=1 Tax=Bhargavaea ginsengi TaxID=426757 RepID=UPI003C723A48
MDTIEIYHELITHDDRGYLIRVSGDDWTEQRNFKNAVAGAYFALEGVLTDFYDQTITVYTDNPVMYAEWNGRRGLQYCERIREIADENNLTITIKKYETGSDLNGSGTRTNGEIQ